MVISSQLPLINAHTRAIARYVFIVGGGALAPHGVWTKNGLDSGPDSGGPGAAGAPEVLPVGSRISPFLVRTPNFPGNA